MKTLDEVKRALADQKEELRARFGVKQIGVFGSCVRGEQAPGSDIDILVDFETPIGFFKFLDLEEYLSQLLGRKVDLVTPRALKPHIGRHIMREVIMI